jgi:hypothetical protein
MFVLFKRKHLQLLSILLLVSVVSFVVLTTSNIISPAAILDPSDYWSAFMNDKKKSAYRYVDPEVLLGRLTKQLYKKKITADLENKYWLADTSLKDSKITIPSYFSPKDPETEKPPIQPFDPRFTLGIYFNHLKYNLKSGKQLDVPFHWYDWKDLSILNKYLLVPESQKPDCSILDARPAEERQIAKDEKKKQEEEARRKEEERKEQEKKQNKQRQEEEEKKKATEKAKAEEEEKLKKLKQQVEAEVKAKVEEELKEKSKLEKPEKDSQGDQGKVKKDIETNHLQNEKLSNDEHLVNNNSQNEADASNKPIVKREDDDDSVVLEKRRTREAFEPSKFCLNNAELPEGLDNGNKIHPGFNVFGTPGRTTRDFDVTVGASFLYSYAPPPEQIIFLTKDGSYKVGTSKRRRLMDNGLVEAYLSRSKTRTLDVLREFKTLQRSVSAVHDEVISDYNIKIPEESFTFDHDTIMKDLEERLNGKSPKLTPIQTKYYESLAFSRQAVAENKVTKYFHESRIIGTLLGDHYDWRFTNGVHYGAYEQTLVLHRLVRTWLSFCRKNGVTTWVAHGSLLSWYWNGIAFPWDNDIDVQVPVMDLHKLSMEFNQTLVVEDVEDGYGRYFLDCGTFISLRDRGNGLNNIDARFIDVDTGLYIDITGLAISNASPPERYKTNLPKDWKSDDNVEKNTFLKTYNCRNNHFSSYDELSPLIRTLVEGEIGYVPKKYADILKVEYSKGMLSKKFSGHVFVPQLRLWVKEDDIYYFLLDKDKWVEVNSFSESYKDTTEGTDKFNFKYELTEAEKKQFKKIKSGLNDDDLKTMFELPPKDLIKFMSKDDVFMSFYTTFEFTQFHEEEIMRLLYGKSASKLVDEAPDFPPMKYDPFMYKMHSDYLTFEDEVNRYLALVNAYKETNQVESN